MVAIRTRKIFKMGIQNVKTTFYDLTVVFQVTILKSTFTKLNDKNLETSLEDSDIIAKWESLILLVK